ncbi:hypothetical protein PT276_07690 [Orbaceae bacterium ESL0721]|nr:hypothetical protein [Orbaceae bacterium ESL0721]
MKIMSDIFLYNTPILPEGFIFPQTYIDTVINSPDLNLEPWTFLCRDMATSLSYYGSMLIKYPDHPLIPFAIVNDETGYFNDGYVILACFYGNDKNGDPRVYYHDYGSRNKDIAWDKRYYLTNFTSWLETTKEESAQFKLDMME